MCAPENKWWSVHSDVFSTCAQHKWREEFRLGHMSTMSGGCISDWDAFSACSEREQREQCPMGHVHTVK